MRKLALLTVMFLWFSGKKVQSAPGDYNIPVRNIGNTSINTTVTKTTSDWGFFIQNPNIPSPVVPGTMGFAQLVPWNQNTFTVNGSGQLDLAAAFFTWLETDYVPRTEIEDMIDKISLTPGPAGPTGPQGVQGEKGDKGDKGDIGDTGPAGPTGAMGAVGATGNQGPKGDQGDVGPAGPQGVKGDKGDAGNTGAQGPKGDTGDQGPQGIQGPIGLTGATGATGPAGINATTTATATTTTNGLMSAADKVKLNAAKRQEAYSGTTNVSGVYTVTFGTAFATAPNIQANLINAADNQNIRITAISTTGFTVLARNRVDVIGLLPTWTNVSGIGVDVLVTEK